MKITRVETFILHVPVTRQQIADSTHQITHWGAPGVIIHTDNGLAGYGFGGTHAHLPTDRLITDCIANVHAPLLLGKDPHEVQWLWRQLAYYPPAQWVDRSGTTHLALAAVDIALWDLKAKAAGLPLWKYLGGSAARKVEIYNTDGGWLNWSLQMLVDDCKRLVEQEGFRGIKIKVGSPDPYDDLVRIEAVRKAIGPRIKVMVDVNGKWDLTTACRIGQRFADYDLYWFEEPTWYDDVEGHATLARKIGTPIALGEQLGLLDSFREFIKAGAVHFVQPDVTAPGRDYRVVAGGRPGAGVPPARLAARRRHGRRPAPSVHRPSRLHDPRVHPVALAVSGGAAGREGRLHRASGDDWRWLDAAPGCVGEIQRPLRNAVLLVALFFVGLIAGFVDAIAGGGGLLTLPSLILLGNLPANLALGTNKGQGVFGTGMSLARFAHSPLLDRRRALDRSCPH